MYGSDDDKKPAAGLSRKSGGGMSDMLKKVAQSIASNRMASKGQSKPAPKMGKPSGLKPIPAAPRSGKQNLKPIPLAPRKKDK